MWTGSDRLPWESGPCLNEECDRTSVGQQWFCCGLCADAADYNRRPARHSTPCNERHAAAPSKDAS